MQSILFRTENCLNVLANYEQNMKFSEKIWFCVNNEYSIFKSRFWWRIIWLSPFCTHTMYPKDIFVVVAEFNFINLRICVHSFSAKYFIMKFSSLTHKQNESGLVTWRDELLWENLKKNRTCPVCLFCNTGTQECWWYRSRAYRIQSIRFNLKM